MDLERRKSSSSEAPVGYHPTVAKEKLKVRPLAVGDLTIVMKCCYVNNSKRRENLVENALKSKKNLEELEVVDEYGRSTLCHAVLNNRIDIAKKLIEVHKCQVNLKDVMGNTLLHTAAEIGHEDMAMYVMNLFMRKNISLDQINKKGMTPLHLACINGNYTIAWKLVYVGKASLKVRDKKYNMSPRQWLRLALWFTYQLRPFPPVSHLLHKKLNLNKPLKGNVKRSMQSQFRFRKSNEKMAQLDCKQKYFAYTKRSRYKKRVVKGTSPVPRARKRHKRKLSNKPTIKGFNLAELSKARIVANKFMKNYNQFSKKHGLKKEAEKKKKEREEMEEQRKQRQKRLNSLNAKLRAVCRLPFKFIKKKDQTLRDKIRRYGQEYRKELENLFSDIPSDEEWSDPKATKSELDRMKNSGFKVKNAMHSMQLHNKSNKQFGSSKDSSFKIHYSEYGRLAPNDYQNQEIGQCYSPISSVSEESVDVDSMLNLNLNNESHGKTKNKEYKNKNNVSKNTCNNNLMNFINNDFSSMKKTRVKSAIARLPSQSKDNRRKAPSHNLTTIQDNLDQNRKKDTGRVSDCSCSGSSRLQLNRNKENIHPEVSGKTLRKCTESNPSTESSDSFFSVSQQLQNRNNSSDKRNRNRYPPKINNGNSIISSKHDGKLNSKQEAQDAVEQEGKLERTISVKFAPNTTAFESKKVETGRKLKGNQEGDTKLFINSSKNAFLSEKGGKNGESLKNIPTRNNLAACDLDPQKVKDSLKLLYHLDRKIPRIKSAPGRLPSYLCAEQQKSRGSISLTDKLSKVQTNKMASNSRPQTSGSSLRRDSLKPTPIVLPAKCCLKHIDECCQVTGMNRCIITKMRGSCVQSTPTCTTPISTTVCPKEVEAKQEEISKPIRRKTFLESKGYRHIYKLYCGQHTGAFRPAVPKSALPNTNIPQMTTPTPMRGRLKRQTTITMIGMAGVNAKPKKNPGLTTPSPAVTNTSSNTSISTIAFKKKPSFKSPNLP